MKESGADNMDNRVTCYLNTDVKEVFVRSTSNETF